jgi:hypothetical protein
MINYLPHHEDVWKYSFTLTLDGGEWLDSRPCRFTSRDIWVGVTAGLDAVERYRCRWEHNVEIDLKKVGSEGVG